MQFDTEKRYYVYGWFLEENDKCFYVGKGTGIRWRTRTRKENKKFTDYVKSHECYSKKIEENLDEETAFKREQYWISYYKNIGDELINVQDGGHLPPSHKGIPKKESSKLKMSKTMKDFYKNHPEVSIENSKRLKDFLESDKSAEFKRKSLEARRSPEFRKAQSIRSKKICNTPEYIERQSQIVKNAWKSDEYRKAHSGSNNCRAQKVQQFDLNGNLIAEYETVTKAQNATGVNFSKISAVARGKRKTAGGYIWKYPNPNPTASNSKSHKGYVNKNQTKPILQYDFKGNLIKEFPSIAEAARITGVGRTNIISNLKGKTKSAYGFVWKYK